MYTIKEIADLAGVTTRTLRYYDQLGLLNPAEIGENGYRNYNHEDLLRLQQIMFFRELDVPLKEIDFILKSSRLSAAGSFRKPQKKPGERIGSSTKIVGYS